MTRHFGDVSVGESFDADDDLMIKGEWLKRDDVRELRDHLTAVLGDAQALASGAVVAPLMPPAEALKAAEETVTRLAPAANTRGFPDGTAPLRERMDAILRIAAFLMTGGRS